jgi:hypothetical protein
MKRLDLGLSPAALDRLFDELEADSDRPNAELGFREFERHFRAHRRSSSKADDSDARSSSGSPKSQKKTKPKTTAASAPEAAAAWEAPAQTVDKRPPRGGRTSSSSSSSSSRRGDGREGTRSAAVYSTSHPNVSADTVDADDNVLRSVALARVKLEGEERSAARTSKQSADSLSREQREYLAAVARQSSERKLERAHANRPSSPARTRKHRHKHNSANHYDWDGEISRAVLGTADGTMLDFDADITMPWWGRHGPERPRGINGPTTSSSSTPSTPYAVAHSSSSNGNSPAVIGAYEQERRRLGLSAETPRH